MVKKKLLGFFCLGAVTLAILVDFTPMPKTSAAGRPPTGITLSPAFSQVTIATDETVHPVSFKITNDRPTAQSLLLSTADFNALDETGGLLFVGSNPTQLQKKYGLAKWLSLPQNSVTIQPKQTVSIVVNIQNDASLPAGGHYGAVMIQLAGESPQSAKTSIAVRPIASFLMFVTKTGGDTHRLRLSQVSSNRKLLGLPGSVSLRFYNDGNTQLIPRGTVTITAPGGKPAGRGIVNDNSGLIFPQRHRIYAVAINRIGSPLWPGVYHIKVDFRFDGIAQFRSYQSSFFVLPPIGLILGLLALSALGYGSYFLLKKKLSKSR